MDLTQHTGRGGVRASWSLVVGSVHTASSSARWSLAVGQPDPQLSLRSNWTGWSAKYLWGPLSRVPSGTGEAHSTRPRN